MGFYQNMTRLFGGETTVLLKRWASYNIKLANALNRKMFLLRCRKFKIHPRHIQDLSKSVQKILQTNSWRITGEMQRHVEALCRKNLNLEIKICYHNIIRITSVIRSAQEELKECLPLEVINEYSRRLNISFDSSFNRVKRVHIKKFNKLRETFNQDIKLFIDNKKWFNNVSDVEMPTDVSDFLSLGPKFGMAVSNKQLNVKHFLADVEDIITEVPGECKNGLRAHITNNITNFLAHGSEVASPWLRRSFEKSRRFLREHPELYILQADKGSCTVAMNRGDYLSKVDVMLNDTNTYRVLNKDPTVGIQKSQNQVIKSLLSSKELDEATAKRLTVYNANPPKLYCLPKIHKQNVPLRPIVSCVGSVSYNLSKFMADILTNSLAYRTEYNVRDTFSFVDAIKNTVLPDNYVLISLDVKSLFTSIPLSLVIEILESHWHVIESNTSISKHNFFRLLDVICGNCYFSVNGNFYKQIFGTPMGSPISPILAQVVMDFVLDTIREKLPFPIPFLYKYVDDLLCTVPGDQITQTLDLFNSINEHIQFTIERETNKSVPFLDTLVIRTDNNQVILNWYQKPSSSGRYINYYSNHPNNQKYNTVIAMKNRVMRISDGRFVKDNLNKVFQLFLNNGYPKGLLRRLIYNSASHVHVVEKVDLTSTKYKKLPYIKGLTNNVISRFREFKNLKIAKYNSQTIGSLFTRTKDSIPLSQTCNVVYRVPCRECEACYIGQTTQNLKYRITQHKSDNRIGKKSCALSIHSQKFKHTFDFDNVKILERECNYTKRLFLEMAHINCKKESINFRTDIDRLSVIYCNLIFK